MTDTDAADLTTLLRNGHFDQAAAIAQRWLGEGKQPGFAHLALGIIAYRKQDYEGAVTALKQAIAIQPTGAAWSNLGAAYRATGKLDDAAAAYEQALALDPTFADAAANYANVLADRGRYAESEAMARRAIAAGAQSHHVYVTLGNAEFRQGDLVAAAHSYQTALSLGYNISAVRNLGSALANLARFADATAVYSAALAQTPSPELHSSYLICLNYDPDISRQALAAAHSEYATRYTAQIKAQTQHPNRPTSDRPLKVGYVSPDLCNHVVASFMLPLMEHHDRASFDIHCYADIRSFDDTSRKFEALSKWRQTTGLSDERLADLIRADEIDILIDLAGHSPGNRQLMLAMKPAPVQLSYVIGTGTTTGLHTYDGLIADSVLLPPDVEHDITEPPLALDRPFVAYAPPPTMPPVGPLPARTAGHVTFGYFGRPIRLNDSVVRIWSEILRAVPNSKLKLDNIPYAIPSVQADITRRFAAHGIGADRLDLGCTRPHAAVLAAYNTVDIALDPFPQNGGTTSLEALWMGVPTLTLIDRPPVGRLGASLLGALDLPGWIARNETEYVNKAISAARDIEGLAALRQELRHRCERSALADVPGLTRAMEGLYRRCWQTWCRSLKREPHGA